MSRILLALAVVLLLALACAPPGYSHSGTGYVYPGEVCVRAPSCNVRFTCYSINNSEGKTVEKHEIPELIGVEE